MLGGNTAALWEGRMTQYGRSTDVYRQPVDEITARVYSDPPMNSVHVQKTGNALRFPDGQSVSLKMGLPDGDFRAGFRANHLRTVAAPALHVGFSATLLATELTGSETFIHVDALGEKWIGLVHGVPRFEIGQILDVYLDPKELFYFDQEGRFANAQGHTYTTGSECSYVSDHP